MTSTADAFTDGELIEDPALRQRYRLTQEGNVLRNELWAEPGARVPDHYHPQIEERFEVLEGEFTFKVEGKRQRATPGDRLVVPAGVRHSFENTGTGVARFRAEIEPALTMRQFFEDSAALGRAGKFSGPGRPKGLGGLLAGAELLDRYRDIMVVTSPPPFLQRVLNPLLARIERRRQARSRQSG
jgi:quercetin dioxygenase-like cupin family protein